MKKNIFFLLALPTFFLAGCAPAVPSQTSSALDKSITFQNADTTQTQSQSQSQSPAPESPQPIQQVQDQKGSTMKTLKDFEKITATEATIKTNKGDLVITLFPDKSPLTVTNFLTLAKSGYYNGIKFHRIIPDFMAQVGDPLTKDDSQKAAWGTGGPGYTIQDEYDQSLGFESDGVVAMANTGAPNSGGSQFFITYSPYTFGNGKYPIFGKLKSGMDILKSLQIGDQIISVTYK